jgi:hypothetical protein
MSRRPGKRWFHAASDGMGTCIVRSGTREEALAEWRGLLGRAIVWTWQIFQKLLRGRRMWLTPVVLETVERVYDSPQNSRWKACFPE